MALWMPRGARAIEIALAAMEVGLRDLSTAFKEAGHGYLPCDDSLPLLRVLQMLSTAGAGLLVATEAKCSAVQGDPSWSGLALDVELLELLDTKLLKAVAPRPGWLERGDSRNSQLAYAAQQKVTQRLNLCR